MSYNDWSDIKKLMAATQKAHEIRELQTTICFFIYLFTLRKVEKTWRFQD